MRRKGIIALLVLVPVLALVCVILYRRSHPAGSSFRTVQVGRADITQRVASTGNLQPVIFASRRAVSGIGSAARAIWRG
jgi:hypothetical protein